MAALTADRDTLRRDGVQFEFPVAASTKIYAGSIVCVNTSNLATKGAAATGLRAVGVAEAMADNSTGSASDIRVKVRRGVFRFGNSSGADAIALKDVGKICYIVDDQTVALTNGSNARSVAGVVADVDSSGVWVDIGADKPITASAALNFASIAAAASEDLTIALSGASTNDSVSLGLPAALTAGIVFQAFVSAADTVTVRATNITAGAVDPASATYRVTVLKV